MTKKDVTIIIIAKNEEKNLPLILDDIIDQTYDHKLIDILLIDSNSTDKTRLIMESFKEKDLFRQVKILDNKQEIQATGWNIGLKNFNSEFVVRIDAHSSIEPDFIEQNVKIMENGENVTGGPRPNIINPNSNSKMADILLSAENAIFGVSFSSYRSSQKEHYAKSVFHGMIRRKVIDEVGYVDERLGRTEDNDFYQRVREKGYKIFLSPKVKSYQFIRDDFKQSVQQKYNNGYWIGKTIFIKPKCLSVFHFFPFIFVLTLMVSIAIFPYFKIPLMLLLTAYFLFLIINLTILVKKDKLGIKGLLIFGIIPVFHLAYGWGTMVGIIKNWRNKEL